MSRITGTDALNMMEAYNAIYAPQELTEEQVWEEVEAWVNSLVEEGYDLSEYTWEDMYEAYIGEDIKSFADRGGLLGAAQRAFARSGTEQGKAQNRAAVGRFFGGINQAALNRIRQNVPQTTSSTRPTPTSTQQNLRGLSIGPGGFNINGRPVQTTPARPSAPAATASSRPAAPARPVVAPTRPAAAPARPVAQAPARPVAAPQTQSQKPTTAPAVSPIERRTPTSAELRQAQQFRTTGANLTGTGALATPTAAPTTAPATTPAPAATARPNLQQSIRNRRLNMDLDLFDIVKGYLIDEGYAETEQAAAVIMANMSEEWKESILDEGFKKMNRSKIEKQAERLGGDRGNILRYLANRMDTPEERKYSTSKARKNRSGSGEYRQAQHLRARDDAKADFEKYGLR